MRVTELDTPVLTVDQDGLEANLKRYHQYFRECGIALRPHIKTHKCLAIAHAQIRAGATGITCQKLSEAEVMLAGGVSADILIPYNIMGAAKLVRLGALARQCSLTVAADSEYTVAGLGSAAREAGAGIGVVIELYQGRTGVESPAAAVALGQRIQAEKGLELRGVMIMPAPPGVRPLLQETLDLFDRQGLPHPIVSGGSTPSALTAHEIPELTEYRVGEYCVGGESHLRRGTHTVEQCALRVLATVVSRPAPDRAVLDGGSKTFSASMLKTDDGPSMGYIVEYPDARFTGASEEHGQVDLSRSARKPVIGERVQILPVHPCPCVNEHDEIVAVRQGLAQARWPVHARGCIR